MTVRQVRTCMRVLEGRDILSAVVPSITADLGFWGFWGFPLYLPVRL